MGAEQGTDTRGNYLTVKYGLEGGQRYPARIEYTLNDNAGEQLEGRRLVTFEYGVPNQIVARYLYGSLVYNVRRLSKIQTHVKDPGQEWNLVKEYRFVYNDPPPGSVALISKSPLAAVYECSSTDPARTLPAADDDRMAERETRPNQQESRPVCSPARAGILPG